MKFRATSNAFCSPSKIIFVYRSSLLFKFSMLFNLPFDLKLPKENEIRSDVSRKPILISILENPQNNFCNCTHILLLRSTNNAEELEKK